MPEFLVNFFHIPTLVEATAIKTAGSVFNISGIIAFAWFKIFFVIYVIIGLLMFLKYVYNGLTNAYKDAYKNVDVINPKAHFEANLESNFEEFIKIFFIHLFLWPIGAWEYFDRKTFNFSGMLSYIVDKWDRRKNPEKYIAILLFINILILGSGLPIPII